MHTTNMQTAISGIFSNPSSMTAFPASDCQKAQIGRRSKAWKALPVLVDLDHSTGWSFGNGSGPKILTRPNEATRQPRWSCRWGVFNPWGVCANVLLRWVCAGKPNMHTTNMQTAISGIFSNPSSMTAFPASDCQKAQIGRGSKAWKALPVVVHLDHTTGWSLAWIVSSWRGTLNLQSSSFKLGGICQEYSEVVTWKPTPSHLSAAQAAAKWAAAGSREPSLRLHGAWLLGANCTENRDSLRRKNFYMSSDVFSRHCQQNCRGTILGFGLVLLKLLLSGFKLWTLNEL